MTTNNPPEKKSIGNNNRACFLAAPAQHYVTSSWGGQRYLPYVFTEQGIAMLSSVLHSSQAIQVNIEIMRAFVRLRKMGDSHKELREQIHSIEKKYDKNFKIVFAAIDQLLEPLELIQKRPIGFT